MLPAFFILIREISKVAHITLKGIVCQLPFYFNNNSGIFAWFLVCAVPAATQFKER